MAHIVPNLVGEQRTTLSSLLEDVRNGIEDIDGTHFRDTSSLTFAAVGIGATALGRKLLHNEGLGSKLIGGVSAAIGGVAISYSAIRLTQYLRQSVGEVPSVVGHWPEIEMLHKG